MKFKYALCGALAGFVNGFFGAGGGMVLVPMLIFFGKVEDKKAFSSAICIILPFCLISLAISALHGVFPLAQSVPYLIGGSVGGVIAGLTFSKISPKLLHIILGILILFGGVRLILC